MCVQYLVSRFVLLSVYRCVQYLVSMYVHVCTILSAQVCTLLSV